MSREELLGYSEKIKISGDMNNIRYPAYGQPRFDVSGEGIVEITVYYDQYNEPLSESSPRLVMPKEAFVKAYKMFIEGGE